MPRKKKNKLFGENKPGKIKFHVLTNTIDEFGRAFEINNIEVSGCALWAEEGYGIEGWIEAHIDLEKLKEGHDYIIDGMRCNFFKIDGLGNYPDDYDEEWSFKSFVECDSDIDIESL